MSYNNQHGLYGIEDTYRGVISDVIVQVREAFLDESVDVDVLQQLKKTWETKMAASGAVDLDGHSNNNSSIGAKGGGTHQQQQQHQAVHQVPPPALRQPPATTASRQQQQHHHQQQAHQQTVVLATNPPPPWLLSHLQIAQIDGGKGKTTAATAAPGMTDESSEEEDREDEEDPTLAAIKYGLTEEQNENDGEEKDEPLNSGDDQSDDEDLGTLFDADNVVVCQFEKVHRVRNKWKFTLKDGIMQIRGKEYCFQKCTGEAEW